MGNDRGRDGDLRKSCRPHRTMAAMALEFDFDFDFFPSKKTHSRTTRRFFLFFKQQMTERKRIMKVSTFDLHF